MADDPTAALEEIRKRAEDAKEYMQGDPMPSSLDDVPRLLAAVEVALEMVDGVAEGRYCALDFREAITREVTAPPHA